jgi:hypothetical protein
MELHILDRNQHRLLYASLCFRTFGISTPDILLCKNRFLHVTPIIYTPAYKLMASRSQETNDNQNPNDLLSRLNPFFQHPVMFLKKAKVTSVIGKNYYRPQKG